MFRMLCIHGKIFNRLPKYDRPTWNTGKVMSSNIESVAYIWQYFRTYAQRLNLSCWLCVNVFSRKLRCRDDAGAGNTGRGMTSAPLSTTPSHAKCGGCQVAEVWRFEIYSVKAIIKNDLQLTYLEKSVNAMLAGTYVHGVDTIPHTENMASQGTDDSFTITKLLTTPERCRYTTLWNIIFEKLHQPMHTSNAFKNNHLDYLLFLCNQSPVLV